MTNVMANNSGFTVKFDAPVFKKPLPSPIRVIPQLIEQFVGPVEVVRQAREEAAPTVQQPQTGYSTFQLIPHAAVKNEKIDQFAKVIANSYTDLFARWHFGLKLDDPDRVFFETVIEPQSFRTYITTNAPLVDAVKSHANTTWKDITLIDADSPLASAESANSVAYDLRLKHPFFLSLSTDRRLQETPLAEIAELSRSMSDGDRVIVQFGFQAAEDGWQKVAQRMAEDFKKKRPLWWTGGDLNKASVMKPGHFGFDFSLRILVTSHDERRRHRLAQGVILALRQLNGDNELTERKVRPWSMNRWLRRLQSHHIPVHVFREKKKQLITDAEIAHFVKLPQRTLQEKYPEVIETVNRPETAIPDCFSDESGLFVGTATHRDKEVKIHIPTANTDTLMTARAFMGSPRQGKDQAIVNLIVESHLKQGIGAIIPDWIDERKQDADGNQRGMADAIRDALPPECVIDIDWSDFDYPVPFGLTSITRNIANSRIAADRIAKELTNFLMGGDIENHTTREYLRDAAKVCSGDLLDIRRLFIDSDFRKEKIAEMERINIGDAEMWRQFDEDLSDARRAQIFAPVNVRLGEIVNDEVLAPIFCQQPNPQADIRKWIEQGKVVILRIPTGSLSEMSVKILAYYSIMVPFLIKLSMNGVGCPAWIVINEPHQVETPEFVHFINRILAEGPKYQLAPIFAFHHLGQLSKNFAESLLSSSLSWHLFYNSNMQMYEKLKAQIEPFSPELALKQTPRFHFIAAGWRDAQGITQPAFMVKAPDLVKNRWGSRDNSRLTKDHARQYGRPIEEVLADIKQRTRIAKKLKSEGGGKETRKQQKGVS